MPYPRFSKVIISLFISKVKTISTRNMINLHTIRDDSLLGTLKFVSKTQDYQQYGALNLDDMINRDIKNSKAYKNYYDFATGKVPPRKARKYKKVAPPSRKLSPVKEVEPVKKTKRVIRPAKKSTTALIAGVVIIDTPGVFVSKKKAPAKANRSKGIEILFDVALSEATQLKEAIKRSKKDFHISQASGLGDGTDFESRVPDEQQRKTSGTDEGTDDNDDINDDDDDDDNINDDDSENKDDDGNDVHDSERTNSYDDYENPSLTLKDYDKEEHDKEYEFDDDNENVFEKEDDDLYKDVNVRSLGAEHEKERKGNEEMTDADQNVSQEKLYEQVVKDAHVTLTSSQKTESSKQSSSVSSDFASKFLILDNIPLVVDEVAFMMNVKNRQEESSTQAPSLFTVTETAIPKTTTTHATTVPPTISMITPLPQLTTPSPEPTTVSTTTLIHELPDFLPYLDSIKEYATRTAFQSYTKEFEKQAQEERKLYIDVVEKSNVVLAKYSSQPKSTHEATTSLTEFELKKILLDKIQKSKSYQADPKHREIYDGLVKSYNLEKDLFSSYENVYSLKRDLEEEDKDEDPLAGSNQSKSVQAEELVFQTANAKMSQDQGGDTEDQPNVKATIMDDWFKKSERPLTPNLDWNATKPVDSRPPQKWISIIAQAEKPPLTFDELMSTPIDFSAYVMHNLKIDNLTQEILVGTTFNLLKETCKSFVELEYHFEEYYKAVTDQLDWNNPEGHEYPFDLSKLLPLIEA
uniref:Uncharacterized protein n=1 Tax=Tanacetum cinerariifolium TaxID=118510 RepID=A0A699GXH3_TANCI|nr:hypothetical protein [Tanacetum cinerariifolium]